MVNTKYKIFSDSKVNGAFNLKGAESDMNIPRLFPGHDKNRNHCSKKYKWRPKRKIQYPYIILEVK